MDSLKLEFDVCRAHDNMENKLLENVTKKYVIRYLLGVKDPENYDVRAGVYDGKVWDFSWHATGEDFLNNTGQFDSMLKKRTP